MTTNASDANDTGIGAWLAKPTALIQFIAARKMDHSHPVWLWKKIILISALFFAAVLAMMIFLDPKYLDYLRQRDTGVHVFFELLTKFADSAWVLITFGIFILSLQIASGDKFSGKLHAVWHRMFFTAWFVLYSIAISGIIALFLKFAISRARPNYVVDDNTMHFEPFTLGYSLESFPSGHATTTGAMIVALCLFFKGYKWLIIPLGLLIASTRFVLGAHFPSDVVAGLFFGGMFAWIYARSMAKHRLLFKFLDDGSLELRKEGRGYCNYIPAMIVQGFGGAKAVIKKNT